MEASIRVPWIGRVAVPFGRVFVAVALQLIAAAAVLLIPVDRIGNLLRYSGYWILFLIAALFAVFVWRGLRKTGEGLRVRVSSRHFLLSVLAGCYVLFLHADLDYKVAMDDYVVVSASQSLHEDRELYVRTSGNWVGTRYIPQDGYVDKRPWLFPFALSVVHDIAGFRPANAFLLNAALGILFLVLTYHFAHRVGGRFAALLAVLLVASIPLVSQNATGGGIDMANLSLLALTIYLGGIYLRLPSAQSESVFVLSALMLVYARYESVLYVAPAAAVVLLGWLRAKRVFLSCPAILSGLLLSGSLLQNRLFRSSSRLWELPEGVTSPFGMEHLFSNLPRAVYFFFNLNDAYANSLLVAVLGLIGILFFTLHVGRVLKTGWSRSPMTMSLAVFATFIALNFLILLAYHDGKLDRLFASRLSLPFHLLLVWSFAVVVPRIAEARAAKVFLLTLSLIYIIGWTLPMNSKAVFTKRNYVVSELNWLEEALGPELDQADLVLDHYSTPWAIKEQTVLRPFLAMRSLPWIQSRMADGRFPAVYFVERLRYQLTEESVALQPSSVPEGVFDLELLHERGFRPFYVTRVYKVREVWPERLPDGFNEKAPSGTIHDYTYIGL